ncbi:MAG: DUF2892 domain-containing protein [Deltaproteobacteria bacterium]|nr:DUF2892 domain-containing protein [Deltaproteobacteria bacterium]
MHVERVLRLIAGVVILIGVALTLWVDPRWIWLVGFVGLNLAQSAFTDWCPALFVLKKAGLPSCSSGRSSG